MVSILRNRPLSFRHAFRRHDIVKQPRAFTLVELMIVVALLFLLLAMLLPALGKAKDAALRTQCATNLSQCGNAIANYSLDNGGEVYWGGNPNTTNDEARYRIGTNWDLRNYFRPYMGSFGAWGCPITASIDDPLNTRSWCYSSYSYWPINGAAYPNFGTGKPVPHRLRSAPSTMPLIQDSYQDRRKQSYAPGWMASHTNQYWMATAMEAVNPANTNRRTKYIQNTQGANIATFGLSVNWYHWSELKSAGVQPDWPYREVYSVW